MGLPVVAAVMIREGRVLLTLRPEGVHLAGLWEFPGGKVGAEETEAEALVRELREELGVEAEVGPCLARVEHRYPEKTVALAFFRCRLLPGEEPRPLEVAEFRWVGGKELRQLALPAADRPVIEILLPELTES